MNSVACTLLAAASLFGGAAAQCTTDGNGDGVVDVTDLLGLLGQYGGAGSYDSNGNGAVDVSDLLALLGEYGRSCGGQHSALYLFNGNADDSAGARHGEVSGAMLATDREGTPNAAYIFDGNDKITAPTPFSAGDGDFSIMVWLQVWVRSWVHGVDSAATSVRPVNSVDSCSRPSWATPAGTASAATRTAAPARPPSGSTGTAGTAPTRSTAMVKERSFDFSLEL